MLSIFTGALERQVKLQDLGVQKLLQQLLSTKDTTLFERYIKDSNNWLGNGNRLHT